jgi:hypothetical protein
MRNIISYNSSRNTLKLCPPNGVKIISNYFLFFKNLLLKKTCVILFKYKFFKIKHGGKMNKYLSFLFIFIFIFILSYPQNLKGEEILLNNIKAKEYNQFTKTLLPSDFSIRYDINTQTNYFVFTNIMSQNLIKFSNTKKITILSYLKKYMKWEEKATLKKVKLEKKIGSINLSYFFKFGNEWHSGNNSATFNFVFFSQNIENHQLVLQFSKFNSIKNQFISSKIEDHYLDKESVKKFIETLEDSFLKEKIQEFKKTKEIENEFN